MANQLKDKIEQSLSISLKEAKSKLKALEDNSNKHLVSQDKDQALREQKILFIEKENLKMTQRLEELFEENRILQTKLSTSEIQVKQLEVQNKIKDDEKKRESDVLKEYYSKKLEETRNNSDNSAVLER